MQKNDSFSGITAFVAAAQSGSFTAAADKLGITKSAVSKRLILLESALGVSLFQRGNRRITLTISGERYLQHCLAALNILSEAEDDISKQQTTLSGRLRIDLPAAFGRRRVMPVLDGLMSRYPQLMMSISFRERYIDLAEEGADLAIRIGELANSSHLIARRLTSQTLVLCAAPEYLAQYGEPETIDALAQHRCIVGFRQDQPFYWPLYCEEKPQRIIPPPFYELADGDAMLSTVLNGHGIAQLPLWMAGDYLRDGLLCRVLPASEGAQIPIHVIWLKNTQLPAKTRFVADALIAAAKNGDFD
ncbi:LysR family transcriptional regulator [Morganella psychrotolerans]|uniref:LysR family transcriptional regulator n=1 Tax=Morganella psychrotolerans TaxID=368603 RepID=A0A1B8H7D6_9GAMM|nr:LysR family transcriptional regulator [Morganella psychrotolerans]OBU04970.1 LysR family transcriptional regulator [Morganella psychrotolerans]